MIKFIDPFGRETFVEALTSSFNGRVGFVVRKDRQSFYESWDIETAKQIAMNLTKTIQQLEDKIDAQKI